MGSGLINILHNCILKLKLISIIWFAYPALLNVNIMFYMKYWGITYNICCFQVAHFTTPFSYSCLSSIHSAMNGLLPPEIRVREISAARPEFHARSSTKSKVYRYKIYNEAIMDPFHNHYAYHSAYKLNPHAMQEAANYFVGIHDFTSFANAAHNDGERRPTKKITRFDVTEMVIDFQTKMFLLLLFSHWVCCSVLVLYFYLYTLASFHLVFVEVDMVFLFCSYTLQGAVLQLEVEGTGFLYRQVRNMVSLT
jgi:hypothetical protein